MSSKVNESNCNVFCVFTPLHVLIVEAIIKLECLKQVYVVSFNDNKKTNFYIENRLCGIAEIINVDVKRKKLKKIFIIVELLKFGRRLKNKRVIFYSGQMKSIYSRFLLRVLDGVQVNTFDDGYGNICKRGYFYENDPFIKKAVMFFMGIFEDYNKLIKRISDHYTIYDGYNVYDDCCKNKKKIEISYNDDFKDVDLPDNSKIVRVFLSQPLSENDILSFDLEVDLYKKVVDAFSINLYIPHPLEFNKNKFADNVKSIDTQLIAEEVLHSIASKRKVEVYSFGSSAVLNVLGEKNIKCFWLVTELINTELPDDVIDILYL